MKKHLKQPQSRLTKDQEKLVKYFLGELSEDQELEVDKRLFLDSAYGESVREVEMALTDAYVAGSLTPQQREHFKTRYMVTPDRRKSVEVAYLIRLALTTMNNDKSDDRKQPDEKNDCWACRIAPRTDRERG